MLIQVAGHDPNDFLAGLEVAQRLSEEMPKRTPALLRSAASSLEARCTTQLELGTACGLRIVAAELEDAIYHHPSTKGLAVRPLPTLGDAA